MKKSIRSFKPIVCIVLAILMIVGTMSVAFAAKADIASTGYDQGWLQYKEYGQDWSGTAFTYTPGSEQYFELTKSFDANKTYYLQVKLNNDWYSFNNMGSGFVIDKTMTNSQQLWTENGDMEFKTGASGNYLFQVWVNGNNDVYFMVTYPSTPAPTPSTETIRVYFTDVNDWGTVKCYAMSDFVGAWPGKAMTDSGLRDGSGHWVYYCDVPSNTSGLVFNNNNNGKQTVDITTQIENNRGWYPTNNEDRCSVDTWAPVFTGDKYTLSLNGSETEFNGKYLSAELEADTSYTIQIKYTHEGKVANTYYLPEDIAGAGFTNRALTTTENSYTFTPSESGKYGFTIDTENKTLSCQYKPTRIFYFQDNTASNWISGDDADMWITTDNGKNFTFMTESIDEYTGLKTWSAEIEEPAANTSINFLRANRLFRSSSSPKADNDAWMTKTGAHLSTTTDNDYNYNVWTASYTGNGIKNCYYRATDNDSSGNPQGTWVDGTALTPSGTASDYYWGIYCDTKGNGDTKDFVKMHTSEKNTTDARATNYTLFLPSYVDLSQAKIYTTFYDCKYQKESNPAKDIRRRSTGAVPNTLSLENNTTYTITYKNTTAEDARTLYLKVIKSENTSSMLMNSKNDTLYTGLAANLKTKGWASDYKGAIVDKKGSYKFYDESGKQLNTTGTEIKKIKGRGNSSWEASMELYGKYAYNVNLTEKDKLIDGAASSKKYCILANNMDESAARNTLIYSIGDDAGALYAPKTRIFDMFDKGNYLGSYILAEKVEYGKNTLMVDGTNGAIKSMDSYNEDTATAEGSQIDYDNLTREQGEYNGYKYQYNAYYDDNNVDIYDQALIGEDTSKPAFKKYDYVIEFELEERYQAEASWIEMKNGQHICMKYPEFASKSEMEWIIDQISTMYEAVYTGDYATYSQYMDVNSFAKTYLIQELSENLDAAATSYYISGGAHFTKLVAAPLWDYDWAVGDFFKTKMTTSGNVTMDNPKQWFVKNKSMKTGASDKVSQITPCFEAALAQNNDFWNVCKDEWTNNFIPTLLKYIDGIDEDSTQGLKVNKSYTDSKILLTDIMTSFESVQNMNEVRWHQMSDLLAGEGHGTSSMSWGTKSTSNYTPKSFEFEVGNGWASKSGSTTQMNYRNTVYYLNDWVAKRAEYMSESLYDAQLKYVIDDVGFVAEQGTGDDQDKVTITSITKTATVGGADLPDSDITLNVYVNDEAVVSSTLDAYDYAPITIDAGENEIYVELIAINHPSTSAKSDSQSFINETPGGVVNLNVFFKSSKSYRYIPSINGDEMKIGERIGCDYTGLHEYYWYKAEVEAKLGDNLTLNFTNNEGMDATITLSSIEYNDYYIGVENLNNGKTAVDITDDESKKNYIGSAVNMLTNTASLTLLQSGFTALYNLNGSTKTLGDVNSNNTLDVTDVTIGQQKLAHIIDFTSDTEKLADFNLDGNFTINDSTSVQLRLAKLS